MVTHKFYSRDQKLPPQVLPRSLDGKKSYPYRARFLRPFFRYLKVMLNEAVSLALKESKPTTVI
jgi:hypothetical protein